MNFKERAEQIFSGFRGKKRPPLERFYVLFLAVYIGYLIADIGMLHIRPLLLPAGAPPQRQGQPSLQPTKQIQNYRTILTRNIFNEDGLIPDPLSKDKTDESAVDGAPTLTQLPIKLQGTIVHMNPNLSLATVEISSRNISSSYRVDEEIEGMARVIRIERKRVIFRNLNNGRPEYAEIAEDEAFSFGLQSRPTTEATGDIIEKRGNTDFAIKRTDLENLTSNLSQLLQQARMEPVFSPDGVSVEGFRFVRIQTGTVYEKLGFRVGDMIRSVNGDPVNSPQKAMEMYNLLKSSNYVQLGVERDGREERFNYTIQ